MGARLTLPKTGEEEYAPTTSTAAVRVSVGSHRSRCGLTSAVTGFKAAASMKPTSRSVMPPVTTGASAATENGQGQ